MSRVETSKLIEGYYRHLFSVGHAEILEMVSDGIRHEFNGASATVGRELFADFLEKKSKHYVEDCEDLQILADDGGRRAAAEFTLIGKYAQTYPGLPQAAGQPYRIRVGAFFEIIDGKIARITTYFDFDGWLAQVQTAL